MKNVSSLLSSSTGSIEASRKSGNQSPSAFTNTRVSIKVNYSIKAPYFPLIFKFHYQNILSSIPIRTS
jgi:hypothetical protein